MSRKEEETSYLNENHIDLLSASEEECAMVAQDSPSSEDLDDSVVAFEHQNSEHENFEKIHYENLFEQGSCSEEEMPYNKPGRIANESPHIAEHPGEKGFCKEQSMWHEEEERTVFGGEPNEKYHSQILIMNESGEDE